VPITLGSTPSSRRLRGLLAAGAAMTALTGCSTSFDAQTNAVYDPGAGTNARGGGVDVLNALIVDNADGTGTLSTTLVYNPGEFDDDIELPPTITLDEMTVTTLGAEPIDSTLVAGGIELVPNESVIVGEEPDATVSGDNFAAGDFVVLNLGFDAAAEPVQLQVPVVTREDTDWYDDIAEVTG
jgi:hypothetical protein